jgi:hypothetical protein
MIAGWIRGWQLQFNDTVISRCVSLVLITPLRRRALGARVHPVERALISPMMAWLACAQMDGEAAHRTYKRRSYTLSLPFWEDWRGIKGSLKRDVTFRVSPSRGPISWGKQVPHGLNSTVCRLSRSISI